MMMQHGSFFAGVNVVSPPEQQQQQSDEIVYPKSVVLCSLSSELMARFGWLGYSPPNTDGWRIPLLEISPFDVSPTKREHWMKVWKKWKESEQNESFPYSLVYLYGRNKLALYPTANIIPFAEAKRLGLNLPPPNIQRKIQYHQKFTAKEQKLMKGFDEFTKDIGLAPRRRVAKRVSALEGKENQTPAFAPRQLHGGNVGGRTTTTTLQDSSNHQFSRVVSPPLSDPPVTTVLINRSRGLDAETMELLRQSNPFRTDSLATKPSSSQPPGFDCMDTSGFSFPEIVGIELLDSAADAFHLPPGLESKESSGVAFHLADSDGVESEDELERCVINAGRQVWNARSTHPITIDHDAIQSNFQSTLGVTTTKFTKLVNYWLVHKHHLEKCHNQWFKEFLWFAQTDSDNPWESPPRRRSANYIYK